MSAESTQSIGKSLNYHCRNERTLQFSHRHCWKIWDNIGITATTSIEGKALQESPIAHFRKAPSLCKTLRRTIFAANAPIRSTQAKRPLSRTVWSDALCAEQFQQFGASQARCFAQPGGRRSGVSENRNVQGSQLGEMVGRCLIAIPTACLQPLELLAGCTYEEARQTRRIAREPQCLH